jgi:hypothetical protein
MDIQEHVRTFRGGQQIALAIRIPGLPHRSTPKRLLRRRRFRKMGVELAHKATQLGTGPGLSLWRLIPLRTFEDIGDRTCPGPQQINAWQAESRFRFGQKLFRLRFAERAGVQRDADETRLRIRETGGIEIKCHDAVKWRYDEAGMILDLATRGIMANDHRIGLRVMDKPQRHGRVTRVVDLALPFADIPMRGIGVGESASAAPDIREKLRTHQSPRDRCGESTLMRRCRG